MKTKLLSILVVVVLMSFIVFLTNKRADRPPDVVFSEPIISESNTTSTDLDYIFFTDSKIKTYFTISCNNGIIDIELGDNVIMTEATEMFFDYLMEQHAQPSIEEDEKNETR